MRFIAVEMTADGVTDNRPLGWTGEFLSGSFSEADVATFQSSHAALNAGSQATNARDGCDVVAISQGRRVHA